MEEKAPTYDHKDVGVHAISSDTEAGDVEGIETTKRGLKARHAQMIALGGTIGMFHLSSSGSSTALTISRYWSIRGKWISLTQRRPSLHSPRLYHSLDSGVVCGHS